MDEKKKNIIELLNYVVVGGLTTLVNFVVYFFCTHIQLHYLIANVDVYKRQALLSQSQARNCFITGYGNKTFLNRLHFLLRLFFYVQVPCCFIRISM